MREEHVPRSRQCQANVMQTKSRTSQLHSRARLARTPAFTMARAHPATPISREATWGLPASPLSTVCCRRHSGIKVGKSTERLPGPWRSPRLCAAVDQSFGSHQRLCMYCRCAYEGIPPLLSDVITVGPHARASGPFGRPSVASSEIECRLVVGRPEAICLAFQNPPRLNHNIDTIPPSVSKRVARPGQGLRTTTSSGTTLEYSG